MRSPIDRARRRSNAILLAAAVACILAIVNGGSIFTAANFWLTIPLALAGGFFAALGIREFANVVLTDPAEPWHIRPGALFFLGVALFLINLAYITALKNLAPQFSQTGTYLANVRLLEALAVEFFWIGLLGRPRRQPSAIPPFMSPKPRTRTDDSDRNQPHPLPPFKEIDHAELQQGHPDGQSHARSRT